MNFPLFHYLCFCQAGGDSKEGVRVKQTEEWGEWIRKLKISQDEAVIMAGDFNIDIYTESSDLEDAMEHIGAGMPHLIMEPYNVTASSDNDVRYTDNPNASDKWIDFVLYSHDHLQPKQASQQVLWPVSEQAFNICWCSECIPLRGYRYPDDPKCAEVVSVHQLSDHQPVLGTFVF